VLFRSLLLGESGTGKEVFARYLHRHGSRCTGPFQAVHIPSIPEHLLEAELFGYCRGAFTGALRDEAGRLIKADHGVLFLDEVGDLTPTAQAALLRVLETREVSRIGDGKTTHIDIQVVAATNSNLAQRVKTNTFRLDLYSRLGGTSVHLPSLADRTGDMELLVRHMLRRAYLDRGMNHQFFNVAGSVVADMRTKQWSGNVRDVWSFVQRSLDVARGESPSEEHYQRALLSLDASGEAPGDSRISASLNALSLERFSIETVRRPANFLRRLTLQELGLLNSALEFTRDPVSGSANRARAAAMLKGRSKCSTNEFDRWVSRLLDQLTPEEVVALSKAHPDLVDPRRSIGTRKRRAT
jgi:DNA-binding NtrC family response regulator